MTKWELYLAELTLYDKLHTALQPLLIEKLSDTVGKTIMDYAVRDNAILLYFKDSTWMGLLSTNDDQKDWLESINQDWSPSFWHEMLDQIGLIPTELKKEFHDIENQRRILNGEQTIEADHALLDSLLAKYPEYREKIRNG